MIKIGFLDRSDASWTAGASYSRSMVHALAGAAGDRCEINVVTGSEGVWTGLPETVRIIRADAPRITPAHIRVLAKQEGLDVLLPVTEVLYPDTDSALIGWIPDFQHRHLEKYFTPEQRRQRDRHFGYLIGNCDAMMFSSAAVLEDFRAFYLDFPGPAASVHFSSSLAYDERLFEQSPEFVGEKYRLPSTFALVANQFWKHKNHRLVVEAVARARRAQTNVHIVMVGMLSDSRDVSNPHLSELVRRLSTERLFENISVLGEVPFGDLVALLRCATEVIQPSEFEGWNTTVQDALALGKQVACSDIPTHREQAPAGFFFPMDDAAPLAAHLEAIDWSQKGWGGETAERASLEAERQRGRQWAGGLIDLCVQAVEARRGNARAREGWEAPVDDMKSNPLVYIEYLETENRRVITAHENTQSRLEKASSQLREGREKIAELKQKLQEARQESQAAREEYWREKSKPFRERLREEWLRISGHGSREKP